VIVKKWLKTEIPINSNRNTELIKEITKLKWELKNWMDSVSDCGEMDGVLAYIYMPSI
jgi:hypothetical protein